ncbi:hypothetical protein [Bradyrhizobium sp.]|uniref:hypothetical protein n=1 Tax=Bradyrhizobium sp. TaxID=376 RepID=UPI004037F8CB
MNQSGGARRAPRDRRRNAFQPPARLALLCWAIALIAVPQWALAAPAASTKIRSNMQLSFDCQRPWNVQNYGARATFEAILNGDGSATADLTINGFGLASTVHFEARLGRGSRPAPGGAAQLRVVSASALRGIWSLPNNNLIIDITTSGKSCAVAVSFALKPGQKEYSLWGGSKFYYCSAARVLQASCSAQ